jgi:hypothetical protein
VPVLVAVESRPKGYGHVALHQVTSLSSEQTKRFLTYNLHTGATITSDGLYLYRSLADEFSFYHIPLSGG